MKALMPIFVALIGLKAMKALILSKLAISLVLGFVVYNLVKKSGMGTPMSMTSMTESPMTAYGAPTSAPSSSSYDPSSWEPSSSGGPYSRVWEPSSSASNLAYSSYYPSSSSSLSSSGSPSSTSGSSASSAVSSHSSYSS